MLLNSMVNTDYAAQHYAQYRLCCSGLCSILTMLLNSMLNTNYAAQLYTQYQLCCSTLWSILTMLLRSILNTDNAAQVDAQYRLLRIETPLKDFSFKFIRANVLDRVEIYSLRMVTFVPSQKHINSSLLNLNLFDIIS